MFASASISEPPLWLIAPFVALLVAIAVMPFVHRAWWDKYYPQVSVTLGALTISYYLIMLENGVRVLHAMHEYFSFMVLIGALYVVSGGIHLRVPGPGRPLRNVLFLFLGALLANVIGTTGASMLLIRPWLRLNHYRVTGFHIVFFIFLISNIGGCLTPTGPPLYLGYLRGVPFWWMLQHCWLPWLCVVSALLAVFYVLDVLNYHRAPESVRAALPPTPFRCDGPQNFAFFAVIIFAIFLPSPLRELVMVAAASGSWLVTPRRVHQANDFTFHPLLEVAWLFVGIFATMIPALDYLSQHAAELGVETPHQLYWAVGLLSATLDNAPAYLTLLSLSFGLHGLSLENAADMPGFLATHGLQLVGISLGSVFFGALTYIGNGPNFMVKSIAEQAKVKVPHFFGYIFRYALPILLPLLILIGYFFLHRAAAL